MILALNLNAILKSLVLVGQWVYKRMKAIRFHLINIAARVMGRSRQLVLRLSKGHLYMVGRQAAYGWLLGIRAKILSLVAASLG